MEYTARICGVLYRLCIPKDQTLQGTSVDYLKYKSNGSSVQLNSNTREVEFSEIF